MIPKSDKMPTVVQVIDGVVREQRFQSGDVVRRVRCRLISGSLIMACELSPPEEERGSSIPPGYYVLEPEDFRVSEYGAPRIARDARLCPLTIDWVQQLEALAKENEKVGGKVKAA